MVLLSIGVRPDTKLAALQQEWESVNFFTNLAETTALDRADAVDWCQRLSQRQPFGFRPWFRPAKEAMEKPSDAYSEVKDAVGGGAMVR